MRRTIQASVSSYSVLPASTWRLPITPIASTNTAPRTAATKTKIKSQPGQKNDAGEATRPQLVIVCLPECGYWGAAQNAESETSRASSRLTGARRGNFGKSRKHDRRGRSRYDARSRGELRETGAAARTRGR